MKHNNNNNNFKVELNFSLDYNFKYMLPWKKKNHILLVLSQFRGTFGKDNGKIILFVVPPRQIENNAHPKFWRDNNKYYGIFDKGLLIILGFLGSLVG